MDPRLVGPLSQDVDQLGALAFAIVVDRLDGIGHPVGPPAHHQTLGFAQITRPVLDALHIALRALALKTLAPPAIQLGAIICRILGEARLEPIHLGGPQGGEQRCREAHREPGMIAIEGREGLHQTAGLGGWKAGPAGLGEGLRESSEPGQLLAPVGGEDPLETRLPGALLLGGEVEIVVRVLTDQEASGVVSDLHLTAPRDQHQGACQDETDSPGFGHVDGLDRLGGSNGVSGAGRHLT